MSGKLIGKLNLPTLLKASGVWSLSEQYRSKKNNIWPIAPVMLLVSALETITWDGISPLSLSFNTEYTVTVYGNALIAVKMWGAGGACGYVYNGTITSVVNQGPGGGGGFVSANMFFYAGTSYIMRVGGGGIRTTSTAGSGATYLAGGVASTTGGAQGGGYTGIFKTSVTQSNSLLIAGGGGGGSDTTYSAYGGAGGGLSGLPGASNDLQAGKGGTQTAGGVSSSYNGSTSGGILIGGRGQNAQASLGGGGGGYFGGGGGNVGGGGGGSSFVSTIADVTSGTTIAGSSSTPGNSADSSRVTAGQGGIAGATSGTNGKIVLTKL